MISNWYLQASCFCTSSILRKEVAKNLKGKSKSSQEWLTRQLKDPYVKSARLHNFRCRSAFKLIQINERFNILKPGDFVIDCGAAPGSWSQVAATATNANQKEPGLPIGKVIGIDLQNISPVDGVTFLGRCDFTSEEGQNKISELLNGEKVDTVLSDMAPHSTGMREIDADALTDMSFKVLRFAVMNTKIDGTCLIKLWVGRGLTEFEKTMKTFFENVRHVKPDASRSDSTEIYLLARNFKGAKLSS